ncbi:PRC-barrel domain containing protein [Roseomonas sp. JC162]|uniref:PRC-barrel domain containing protein n=1 Tax=Neoroseomonas marina TaxID=1232220 RepID=A0A848EHT7_9PROT|nr:PRC-barrel domain-containing protein [Neoroseomonas marina]NMJ42958.1 PRC-barrel domain containing protein [Neoroseomonas marina]
MSDPTIAGQATALEETQQLISSDKVEGTSVYGRDRQKIGSVYTLMIDKVSGQVSYAVVSFGGFFGIGSDYYPLPWSSLEYDTELGGYFVSITREQLEGAPRYRADESPWSQPGYGRGVYEYYGMPIV